MNPEAKKENRWTLRNLLGLEEKVAEKILCAFILVSNDENHGSLSNNIQLILEKTFEQVDLSPSASRQYACEVVVTNSKERTEGPYVYVGTNKEGKLMVSNQKRAGAFPPGTPDFMHFLLSCYVGAVVLKSILKNGLQVTGADEI